MSTLQPTPGQTVGPFFGYALPFERDSELVATDHPGAVTLHGIVYDGDGHPVPDALLEIWQADADGAVSSTPQISDRDGRFTGWGRAATDTEGRYAFTTVVPGPVDEAGTPFIAMTVLARGLLHRLLTRIYLPGADDALLASLPADRRRTLVATEDGDGYRFDVRLQGEGETVFLAHTGT